MSTAAKVKGPRIPKRGITMILKSGIPKKRQSKALKEVEKGYAKYKKDNTIKDAQAAINIVKTHYSKPRTVKLPNVEGLKRMRSKLKRPSQAKPLPRARYTPESLESVKARAKELSDSAIAEYGTLKLYSIVIAVALFLIALGTIALGVYTSI